MERRKFITVAGTGGLTIATAFAGCLGSDDLGDDGNAEPQTETAEPEQDAELLEPEASVPVSESDSAAETNIEQLFITRSGGDLDPEEHVVALEYWVQNSAPERRTATLVSTLEVNDGTTYEERRAVSVPGDTVNEYVLPHEIEESTSAEEFSYGFGGNLEW
ncbi:hypothetical protein NDI56_15380 [Haloarcula sp. S1CR25-12]|uniref:DUF5067 domain-containing protein n=1 Tax=Haloarcula saliterrae TaxID=2950534 RepID=A0ABU2FEV2_9EURY|nr:hypothetical protein [Haloarcula sp. S1CR25-12]MDS0260789.1 hypothetical protein [Haloarcula sp. S1CR25-12]